MLLSGAVSFLYEVLWTRLLGQVLGGSTAAFASMLSSFLLGIALGSAIASRFAKTRNAAAIGFAVSQIGSGVLGWFAFRMADRLPDLTAYVGATAATPATGAAAAGIVLLPVTLCIGATFPFGVRLLAKDADEAASVSGRVYAWNTVGSIVGSIGAGFFLLPMLGLQGTALVGVVTSLVSRAGDGAREHAAPAAAGGPRGPRRWPPRSWSACRSPRTCCSIRRSPGAASRASSTTSGVGRSATVTVVEHHQGWRISTNGLPESGVERREVPDLRFNETAWLSLLPTAARPETDEMLIIGLGGSKTLEATASTVKSIDVIELEEEVVKANRLIPREIQALDDPRVHLRIGDARGAMNLSSKRYDAIVSQPSHPWTSGASHLYTRDFFELVHSKLEPGGIFVQWIGAGFVNVELFGTLMAAMSDVFPYVHVYRPVPAAMVFMASDQPIDLLESAARALAAAPESFGRYGIHRVEDFYASWSLDSDGVRKLAEGRPAEHRRPQPAGHDAPALRRSPHESRHLRREPGGGRCPHSRAAHERRCRGGAAPHELERRAEARAQARAHVAPGRAHDDRGLADARRGPPRPGAGHVPPRARRRSDFPGGPSRHDRELHRRRARPDHALGRRVGARPGQRTAAEPGLEGHRRARRRARHDRARAI